jgi:hypothetical protein
MRSSLTKTQLAADDFFGGMAFAAPTNVRLWPEADLADGAA